MSTTDALPELWCIVPHPPEAPQPAALIESLLGADYPADRFGESRIVLLRDANESFVHATRSINTGLSYARDRRRSAPAAPRALFFILRNDAVVERHCLRAAVDCFRAHGWDRTGLVGCLQVAREDTDRVLWGGSLNRLHGEPARTGRVDDAAFARDRLEEWLPLDAVFVNEALLDRIGQLDANLVCDFADADLSFRARAQEWTCRFASDAVVARPSASPPLTDRQRARTELDESYFRKKWYFGLYNYLTAAQAHLVRTKTSAARLEALYFGNPPRVRGETRKARPRREREGFFERFCQGRGIDIGFGGDPVVPGCLGWDWEHGDATYLVGLPPSEFDFVYSSHTLEDLEDPGAALQNWWRVLKPGGHLILYLPHRDLYEKRTTLPSALNPNHRHFLLPDRDDPPDTLGLVPLLRQALPAHELLYCRTCSEAPPPDSDVADLGPEYSMEAVLRKPVSDG